MWCSDAHEASQISYRKFEICDLRFENSVILYGTQTAICYVTILSEFENSVILYGTQTVTVCGQIDYLFENSVILRQSRILCKVC